MYHPFKTISVNGGKPLPIEDICWPVSGELCAYYQGDKQFMCILPDVKYWKNKSIIVEERKQILEFRQ